MDTGPSISPPLASSIGSDLKALRDSVAVLYDRVHSLALKLEPIRKQMPGVTRIDSEKVPEPRSPLSSEIREITGGVNGVLSLTEDIFTTVDV
jgi:hypothetical protein